MKCNRHKWVFTSTPVRKQLTAKEVMYWGNTFSRILKMGIEFEYNLKEERNGDCKGETEACPCKNMTPDNTCWKECANKETCKDLAAGEEFKCDPETCLNFVSMCITCQDFVLDCSKCKYAYIPERDPEYLRGKMIENLSPVKSYGKVGETGVFDVVPDGSLKGKKGAEVVTVGRRVNYNTFYDMINKIMEQADKNKAYTDERCSVHFHALASYQNVENISMEHVAEDRGGNYMLSTELEKDVPEIILANLHQLIRRYQNAMTWMMMTLDDPDHMTRWEKFRVSVMDISSVTNHMQDVISKIRSKCYKAKYGWVNYTPMAFSGRDISRFHLEFRGSDGLFSPSAASAIACMYYALIIKAVQISRYGVVEVGDPEWYERAVGIKNNLLNNTGDWGTERFSNTRGLEKHYEVLREESMDLVRQLKGILMDIGPAYEVLMKLAEKPIALRRCEGQSWKDIEKDLKVNTQEESKIAEILDSMITMNHVTECSDIDEWIETVCGILNAETELGELSLDNNETMESDIKEFINTRTREGRLVWSSNIGSPMII